MTLFSLGCPGGSRFEFTNEVAIFDLLDIKLVHGWLYDPQDRALVRAVGELTYNQLVNIMVESQGQPSVSSKDQERINKQAGGH